MCTQYWTLRHEYECPLCGSHERGELQTHFRGEPGSFLSYYDLGQPVRELYGVSVAMTGGGIEDDFISTCRVCGGSINWAGEVVEGAVVRVWPYNWERATP